MNFLHSHTPEVVRAGMHPEDKRFLAAKDFMNSLLTWGHPSEFTREMQRNPEDALRGLGRLSVQLADALIAALEEKPK